MVNARKSSSPLFVRFVSIVALNFLFYCEVDFVFYSGVDFLSSFLALAIVQEPTELTGRLAHVIYLKHVEHPVCQLLRGPA